MGGVTIGSSAEELPAVPFPTRPLSGPARKANAMVLYAVGLLIGVLLYPVFLLVAWVTRKRRRTWLRRRGLGFLN